MLLGNMSINEACSPTFVEYSNSEQSPFYSVQIQNITTTLILELKNMYLNIDPVAVGAAEGPAFRRFLSVLTEHNLISSSHLNEAGHINLRVFDAAIAAITELTTAFLAR